MWAHALNALLGLWLMAAPAVLGYAADPAATSDRVVGPLLATISIVAIAQCTRGVRFAVLPLALWLLVAPIVLRYEGAQIVNSISAALVAGALALVPGRITRSFAGGWRAVLHPGACGTLDEPAPHTDTPPEHENPTREIET